MPFFLYSFCENQDLGFLISDQKKRKSVMRRWIIEVEEHRGQMSKKRFLNRGNIKRLRLNLINSGVRRKKLYEFFFYSGNRLTRLATHIREIVYHRAGLFIPRIAKCESCGPHALFTRESPLAISLFLFIVAGVHLCPIPSPE